MQAGNAPSWLFSFVDLAFLLLIAMTQMAGDPGPELGEIVVPRLDSAAIADLPPDSTDAWQLRVHPPDEAASPFELLRAAAGVPEDPAARLDAAGLRERLTGLSEAGESKPLLAPHEDSRTRDMLAAVGLIEEFWPTRRRATVAPLLAGR